jgi:ferrous iron transport protein A
VGPRRHKRHRHRWMHRDANAGGGVRLSELSPGDAAVIEGYERGHPAYRSRLLAMGLTRGTRVKVIRVAPLGDPVELEVRGFRLTLRKDEADVLQLSTPDVA